MSSEHGKEGTVPGDLLPLTGGELQLQPLHGGRLQPLLRVKDVLVAVQAEQVVGSYSNQANVTGLALQHLFGISEYKCSACRWFFEGKSPSKCTNNVPMLNKSWLPHIYVPLLITIHAFSPKKSHAVKDKELVIDLVINGCSLLFPSLPLHHISKLHPDNSCLLLDVLLTFDD